MMGYGAHGAQFGDRGIHDLSTTSGKRCPPRATGCRLTFNHLTHDNASAAGATDRHG
jgi:hypothetical protein